MKIKFVFVPPGGGEADYSLEFELPSVPQPGDYISINEKGQKGTSDFIVRRSWWILNSGGEGIGTTDTVGVECEFAIGHYSSDSHKKVCSSYKDVKEFEATAF